MLSGTIALVALVGVTSFPPPASAECPLFSAGGAACAAKPVLKATLGQQPTVRMEELPASARPQPTDCKMVKPVDPQFKSKMPVITPDEKVKFRTPVVPVPSCKP